MEKISEILSALRERLRSPLISSFVIAFIVANWRIWLGLFWYKTEMLQAKGYDSYIDFVVANAGWWICLWGPLIVAVAYTFGWPYLRNRIDEFRAKRDTEGDEKKLAALGKGVMPMKEFIDRKKRLEKTEREVSMLLEAERSLRGMVENDLSVEREDKQKTLEKYVLAMAEKNTQNDSFKNEIEQARKRLDLTVIQGVWLTEIKSSNFETAIEWSINISGNSMTYQHRNPEFKLLGKIEMYQDTRDLDAQIRLVWIADGTARNEYLWFAFANLWVITMNADERTMTIQHDPYTQILMRKKAQQP